MEYLDPGGNFINESAGLEYLDPASNYINEVPAVAPAGGSGLLLSETRNQLVLVN